MRILVVEDETRLAGLLKRGLSEAGHAVDLAESGEDALAWVDTADYDAIVLDVMLPGINGFDVCRAIRRQRRRTTVLLLTAKDAVADRVTGLDAGADDYLVKPFAFAELSARLRALSRRPAELVDPVLTAGEIRLDPATRRVWRGDEEIALGNKQFRILEYLARNPNRVVTRAMIAEHVWDYDFPNVTNVIDVHIRAIRKELGDPYPGEIIQTVRGVGYRLNATK
jgi:two-component system, OmpR family, response regulator